MSRGVVVRLALETADDSAGALTHDAAQAFWALGARAEFAGRLAPVHGHL